MAASSDEVLETLTRIIVEEAGVQPDEVAADKSFADDLGADSLTMMTIVAQAEDAFGVTIPDDEVKNLVTVGDAVTYIADHS